jgi:hypothetical protein
LTSQTLSKFDFPIEIWYPSFWKDHYRTDDELYNPFATTDPQKDWAYLFILFFDDDGKPVFRWEWAPHPAMLAAYVQYNLMRLYVSIHYSWILDGALPANLRNYEKYIESLRKVLSDPADKSEQEEFKMLYEDTKRFLDAFETCKLASSFNDRDTCLQVFLRYTLKMADNSSGGYSWHIHLFDNAFEAVEVLPKLGIWGDENELSEMIEKKFGITYSELTECARDHVAGEGGAGWIIKCFNQMCTHAKISGETRVFSDS